MGSIAHEWQHDKPSNNNETSLSLSMDDSLSAHTWQDGDGVVLFVVSVGGDVALTKRTYGHARRGMAARGSQLCVYSDMAAGHRCGLRESMWQQQRLRIFVDGMLMAHISWRQYCC